MKTNESIVITRIHHFEKINIRYSKNYVIIRSKIRIRDIL